MSKKVSITLDDEVLSFIDQRSTKRSSVINEVLWQEKRRIFLAELAAAYAEQASDSGFQDDVADWDATAGDGIEAHA
ncbi:MAG: hypothetical protein AAF766_20130 [Cyanobacteria bacterium P01_D01_bin.14]